jgi:ketosteroid isomerase-like protein
MSAETVAQEVMRRYFDGVNNENWEDFRQIWHEDAVVDVTGGLHFEGIDEIAPYYPRVLKNFPVHYDDPYAVHVAGDVVTVEIAFRGETLDGVAAEWEAVDVFTLEDGRIRKLTTWYDMGLVVGLLRTPGPPERRLRTLVGRAASSPYYRRRFEELSLSPEAVAEDLTQLPVTRLDGVSPDELVAASERELTHVVQRGDGAWPLTRDDIAERGRLWAAALRLAGVGRGDVVAATTPTPGLAEGVAALRARLAFAADPTAAGATVVVGSLGALDLPETGVVVSPCASGTLHAHTESHVIEILDDELVVTPLGARAAPVLRLATGIRAAWAEQPCSCGSELPALALERAPAA